MLIKEKDYTRNLWLLVITSFLAKQRFNICLCCEKQIIIIIVMIISTIILLVIIIIIIIVIIIIITIIDPSISSVDSYVSTVEYKRTPHAFKVLLLLFVNMYLSVR